ncbi:hypothetical protein JTE90_004756, partial [Oedothorax gibbosus]
IDFKNISKFPGVVHVQALPCLPYKRRVEARQKYHPLLGENCSSTRAKKPTSLGPR